MKRKIEKIAVYCGSAATSAPIYRQAAADLGKLLAESNITLIFGGSNCGTMQVLADSALDNNGKVIGVFPAELPRELMHPDLHESYFCDSLAERKGKMLSLADALIALPGSIGTWDELFDALAVCKISHGKKSMPIIALNINNFYTPLKTLLQNSIDGGFTSKKDKELLIFIDNIKDLSLFLQKDIDFS